MWVLRLIDIVMVVAASEDRPNIVAAQGSKRTFNSSSKHSSGNSHGKGSDSFSTTVVLTTLTSPHLGR